MTVRFIHRPVLSIVISVFITLLGALALTQLPMTLFPSIAPPEVNVTVEFTGANAETVTKAAIVPLERAINGVPGMKYMSSDAGNDGVGVVQIIFEVGTNPDIAAVNVQNRVAAIMGELPEEVIKNGVKIAKEENAMLMYLNIYSNDPKVEEKFLYNFADINDHKKFPYRTILNDSIKFNFPVASIGKFPKLLTGGNNKEISFDAYLEDNKSKPIDLDIIFKNW
jgi:HAE1 family hydrophobic/amphiphilic exporter-1